MRRLFKLSLLVAVCAAAPALAQLGLPPLGGTVRDAVGTVEQTADPVVSGAKPLLTEPAALARAQTARLDRLVRQNRDTIERDATGAPARRGELLLIEGDAAALVTARGAGFTLLDEERLDALDLKVTRLAVPQGMSLAAAEGLLGKLLPSATISSDPLYFATGRGSTAAAPSAGLAPVAFATKVGIIDGAPTSGATTRGFAKGAPRASDHGSAVASLLTSNGVKGLLAADVYGSDPAGGNALAIGKAIDWLAASGAKVVSISLVGPANPLLAKAIAAGQQRGLWFVAAVGNDGPAAPPAYPASYSGVLAVTGVDGNQRALIEAGRALHLDYAAPGADLTALNAAGKRVRVRGTSFAVPLVAVRLAAALKVGGPPLRRLDAEARDLGTKGPDRSFGRGLLCGSCRR